METINHECYVSLEVAKLLKEAGFDWECRKIYYCYHEDGDKWELEDSHFKNNRRILEVDYCLLAPTLDEAQRWLRDVKNYDVFVVVDDSMEYAVCIFHNKEDEDDYYECYKTYEKAQEAGIKKALEIILEKEK